MFRVCDVCACVSLHKLVMQYKFKENVIGKELQYLLRSENESASFFFPFLHLSNNMACHVVAKKEGSLRKNLRFTDLFSIPDENGLLVCTINFRTEEVYSCANAGRYYVT